MEPHSNKQTYYNDSFFVSLCQGEKFDFNRRRNNRRLFQDFLNDRSSVQGYHIALGGFAVRRIVRKRSVCKYLHFESLIFSIEKYTALFYINEIL